MSGYIATYRYMASPISTGGAGIHFESRVAAYYLASVITGGAVRGLPGGSAAKTVLLQRAFEGRPLDDVIIQGTNVNHLATLSLQAKRTLIFGENELFAEVMAQCWSTFSTPGFHKGFDRFGVALGTLDSRFEKAGRTVLAWARESADAGDFFRRIQTTNFASDDMREFFLMARGILDRAAGVSISDDDFWQFLRHFVVLYFDFEINEQSHSLVDVHDRLRYALTPEECNRGGELWRHLVEIADHTKPTAGSLDRKALVEKLSSSFKLTPARNIQADLGRLREVGVRALEDIRTDIGGLRLARVELETRLGECAASNVLIEIVGEAGTGKSALAKSYVAPLANEGPVLVLTAKRMPPGAPGWEGLAKHWGLGCSLNELIAELGCVSTPCLLVDGVDRIEDRGNWLAINDLLNAIRQSGSFTRWRILFTARASSLDYRTRLDLSGFVQAPTRVAIGDLNNKEVAEVAAAHPQIAHLLAKGGNTRELAARPYLLARLVRMGTAGIPHDTLVTEIDLMLQLWSGTGPGDDRSEALVLARQDVLIELGRRRLRTPDRLLTSIGLPAEALVSLRIDDILRLDPTTRVVAFTHDMIEDWVLCQALHHSDRSVAQEIEQAGQPLWLVDAVQLLAQWRLEREEDVSRWMKLLDEVSTSPLEPRWRRAVLTAPLQSTRGIELIERVNEDLWRDEGRLVDDLMVAMRTVEVIPDPTFFDNQIYPDLDDVMRMRAANQYALPRLRSWLPFIAWFVSNLDKLPAVRIEEAAEVLSVVVRAFRSVPVWAAAPVAVWAKRWLDYVDPDSDNWELGYERRKTMGMRDEREFKDQLRLILLGCVEGAPQEVASYLETVPTRRRHKGADFIIQHANWLTRKLPTELVDFMLTVMLESELGDEFGYRRGDLNRLGIEHDRLFFPASHLRPPFLTLLREHPTEGLRLVNGLCNHAMAQWRAVLIHEGSGTPCPVHLRFYWGEKDFWGHYREYTWNRGLGPGPYAAMSALMALEVWIEEQIESGRAAEDVFRQALEGNDCVGALGACAAISLASPDKCLNAAMPLVCSPQVWYWDLKRSIQDSPRGANLIGLPQHRPFLKDVARRNEAPHRRQTVRDLVPHLLFSTPDNVRREFFARMQELEQASNLPYEFEQEQGDATHAEELTERVRRMTALADPKYWQASKAEDGRSVRIEFVPPADIAPDKAFLDQHAERVKAMNIALWAEKSLEEDEVRPEIGLAEALQAARDLDAHDLFERVPAPDDLLSLGRSGAVSGTAAVLARHAESDSSELTWAREILSRAALTPLDQSPFIFKESAVIFHPVVNAVTGLTTLVLRGLASDDEKMLTLGLVCHPLLKVKSALFSGLSRCWEREPLLCWQALVLGMKLSVLPWTVVDERRGYGGLHLTEGEHRWLVKSAKEVERNYLKGRPSRLPRVTRPWVRHSTSAKSDHLKGFRRSKMAFLWHIAPKVLFNWDLGPMMADPQRRQALLTLVSDLMAWTAMDADPPWDHSRSPAYEWAQEFMDWCAKLTAHLTPEETERLIVKPVAKVAASQSGEYLLQSLIFNVLRYRICEKERPGAEVVHLWGSLLDIVLSHRSANWHAGRDGAITTGYGECISLMIFCYGGPLVDHPWPALSAFKPSIEAWVVKFAGSQAYFHQLLTFLGAGGYGLFPEPAMGWLIRVIEDKRNDRDFWAGSNGEKTAQLLERLIEDESMGYRQSPERLREIIRITDILVGHGVRLAAQVQQRLAKAE